MLTCYLTVRLCFLPVPNNYYYYSSPRCSLRSLLPHLCVFSSLPTHSLRSFWHSFDASLLDARWVAISLLAYFLFLCPARLLTQGEKSRASPTSWRAYLRSCHSPVLSFLNVSLPPIFLTTPCAVYHDNSRPSRDSIFFSPLGRSVIDGRLGEHLLLSLAFSLTYMIFHHTSFTSPSPSTTSTSILIP